MDERFDGFVSERLRELGRQYERARRAYAEGKGHPQRAAILEELPVDDAGRAKLVCRRYAEKRAVKLEADGKPACFDPDHTDCVGCLEDIRDGIVETW